METLRNLFVFGRIHFSSYWVKSMVLLYYQAKRKMKMKRLLDKINEYNQIVLYRHINPDLDAFGSQIGMYHILKESFPKKRIVIQGELKSDLVSMFIDSDIEQYCNDEKTLGIVLDTANRERIDGDYLICDELIKIDHHIVVDSYGMINIEDDKASSCSQIVVDIYQQLSDSLVLSKKAAEALYKGIVGDSNRFMYRSTDERTLRMAALLIEKGIDIEAIYQQLYLRDRNDLNVTKFILNHYHYEDGIAYYILNTDDLKELGISREEGSNYVNTLSNIKQFEVWMAITENEINHNYRVSIRSRRYPVNEIANAFNGGGHALASGATLDNIDQLNDLLNRLKEKING